MHYLISEVADSCFPSYQSDETERPVLLSSVVQTINLILNLILPLFTLLHKVQQVTCYHLLSVHSVPDGGLGMSHRLAQLNLTPVPIFQR